MGYSKSKETIQRVDGILEILIHSQTSIKIPSANPLRLSYQIRDALAVVESLTSSPYKGLKKKFILKIKSDHILAILREKPEVDVSLIAELANAPFVEPKVSTVMEVIGAIVKHKAKRFEFPNFTSPTLNTNLALFLTNNNYNVMITIPYLVIEKNAETFINNTEDGRVEHG